MKKRLLSIAVSFALLAALIYFSDVSKTIEVLSRTNLSYIAIGLFIWVIGATVRTSRWNYLLKKVNVKSDFVNIFKIFCAGLFISNITPAKSGEPLRSILLKKSEGYNVGKTLPSIFLERIMDVVAMVVITVMGILFLASYLSEIYYWIIVAVAVYVVLFSLAVYILLSEKRTKKFVSKLHALLSFLPRVKKIKGINQFTLNLCKAFAKYKNKKTVFITLLYSIAIWILEGVILFIAFRSLGLSVSLISTIVIIPIASLISVLTLLPGGIGSAEIITVLFFSSLYGFSLAELTATVLLGRLLSFWVYAVVGAIMLSTLKYKYKL